MLLMPKADATDRERMRKKVTNLLQAYCTNDYARKYIAPMVAEKSLLENHLYEDLGFKNRVQMARFMQLHFPRLASNKPNDKLWKKYIYDLVGEVAPACAFCGDSVNCFACKVS